MLGVCLPRLGEHIMSFSCKVVRIRFHKILNYIWTEFCSSGVIQKAVWVLNFCRKTFLGIFKTESLSNDAFRVPFVHKLSIVFEKVFFHSIKTFNLRRHFPQKALRFFTERELKKRKLNFRQNVQIFVFPPSLKVAVCSEWMKKNAFLIA